MVVGVEEIASEETPHPVLSDTPLQSIGEGKGVRLTRMSAE